MKIALIDVHNTKYDTIYKIGGPLKEAYCKKHGYDCLTYETGLDFIPADRQHNWGRVQGLCTISRTTTGCSTWTPIS